MYLRLKTDIFNVKSVKKKLSKLSDPYHLSLFLLPRISNEATMKNLLAHQAKF